MMKSSTVAILLGGSLIASEASAEDDFGTYLGVLSAHQRRLDDEDGTSCSNSLPCPEICFMMSEALDFGIVPAM